MNVEENLETLKRDLAASNCSIIAVSKKKPPEMILSLMEAGHLDFGENRVQELIAKAEELPTEIRWHMIGHLQTNKVKSIVSFVHLIHSVDSEKLLREIDKQAAKVGRVVDCLLQVRVADEETKYGLSFEDAKRIMTDPATESLTHVRVLGLMGMGTFTDDFEKVRGEFAGLKSFFDEMRNVPLASNVQLSELSMGMTSDYLIAAEEGSTMVRIGSAIFGARE